MFNATNRVRLGCLSIFVKMSRSKRKQHNVYESAIVSDIITTAKVAVRIDFEAERQIKLGTDSINFRGVIGAGVLDSYTANSATDLLELRQFVSKANDFILGYFSYDLKNTLEQLESCNPNAIGFPEFKFFVPKDLFLNTGEGWVHLAEDELEFSTTAPEVQVVIGKEFSAMAKEDYIHKVENLKQHIQFGDVYEVNYCVQHGLQNTTISPYRFYQELQKDSPAPFSCYVADYGKYLMSSSPERFIEKTGNKVVSQPIKGTNRRLANNEIQRKELRRNEKEVAENVMITDLVRNDLSKSAVRGTVKVEELCGVYTFQHVNQMISTVSAELRDDVHPLDAILNAFPMGSMTGAPKIRAMELIDQYEDFSRGLYSGSVGYFTPDLDFDYNVVIRSVLYSEENQVVTFPTGGAITINSDPEQEYEECMLKAEAMRNTLLNHGE